MSLYKRSCGRGFSVECFYLSLRPLPCLLSGRAALPSSPQRGLRLSERFALFGAWPVRLRAARTGLTLAYYAGGFSRGGLLHHVYRECRFMGAVGLRHSRPDRTGSERTFTPA